MEYEKRTLESFFVQATSQFPAMLLTGARQVGKTTFLQHLKEEGRSYITLDDPLARDLAREDPRLFLQRFTPPVLIDEIQYAPQLLPAIKMEVDRHRSPGMFWLTGSQHFSVMKGVSESLAGRVGIVELLGLSYRERIGQSEQSRPFLPNPEHFRASEQTPTPLKLKDLYGIVWRGSLPAIALSEAMDRDLFYGSYVQTYLQRGVRDLTQVGDETTFLRFLRTAAARTGQLVNFADLARDADVAPNTAKKWLSILQSSGIVYLLEPYHTNITKRMLKTPKLYFLDTGLCSYLTEWTSPETLEAGAMSGAILETWVIGEILRSWQHNGRRAPLYYYRDKDRREIDLLIVQDGTVYPVEIKKTASPGRDIARHFQLLKNFELELGPGAVICLAEQALPLTERTWTVPAWAI